MRLIRLLKKDLAREVSNWADDGLISTEQARLICQRYGVDFDSVDSGSAGYRLLVTLGYLFIGLALITLLGANWDDIPRWLRFAGLLIVTLGTHLLALRSYLAGREPGAVGLFLLGNLFYGASIILVAQIYHLGEHMPDGIFWWAAGSLPFGVLLKNTWLTLFSCLLALLWFSVEYGMGYFPTLFPLFIVAGVYVLIQGRPSALLFLTVVGSIGLWVEASLAAAWAGEQFLLTLHAEHIPVSVAMFIFAYAFSHWLHGYDDAKVADYGVLLSLWTLRFGLVAMMLFSFEGPWEWLIEADWDHQPSMWLAIMIFLGVALWLGWKADKLQRLIPLTAFSLVSIFAVLLSDHAERAIYFQVVYNIALVGTGIWLIMRGINSGISHYFFLGVATILVTALMRYVDLVGEYVGGALLFMVLAGLLLGSAKYWKAQREKEAGV